MCDMSPPVGFGRKCPRFLAYKVRHWISFCVVSGYCIRCIYNIYTVMTSWCLLVGWLAAGGGGSCVDWLVMEWCWLVAGDSGIDWLVMEWCWLAAGGGGVGWLVMEWCWLVAGGSGIDWLVMEWCWLVAGDSGIDWLVMEWCWLVAGGGSGVDSLVMVVGIGWYGGNGCTDFMVCW